MLQCINSEYGEGIYATEADFLEMCLKCFGEQPELSNRSTGDVYVRLGVNDFSKVLAKLFAIRWENHPLNNTTYYKQGEALEAIREYVNWEGAVLAEDVTLDNEIQTVYGPISWLGEGCAAYQSEELRDADQSGAGHQPWIVW